MTTVQDLTLGVKSVAARTVAVPNRPPPMPAAFDSGNVHSTSAFPRQQPTYWKVAQRSKDTQPVNAKQPRLQPPAMYKKGPEKMPKAIQTDLRCCDISGPPSFDPYAKGATTTGDYYSVASCQKISNMDYQTSS